MKPGDLAVVRWTSYTVEKPSFWSPIEIELAANKVVFVAAVLGENALVVAEEGLLRVPLDQLSTFNK